MQFNRDVHRGEPDVWVGSEPGPRYEMVRARAGCIWRGSSEWSLGGSSQGAPAASSGVRARVCPQASAPAGALERGPSARGQTRAGIGVRWRLVSRSQRVAALPWSVLGRCCLRGRRFPSGLRGAGAESGVAERWPTLAPAVATSMVAAGGGDANARPHGAHAVCATALQLRRPGAPPSSRAVLRPCHPLRALSALLMLEIHWLTKLRKCSARASAVAERQPWARTLPLCLS